MEDRTATPTARCLRLYQHLLKAGRVTTAQAARLVGEEPRRVRSDLQLLAEIAPITVMGEGVDRVWILDPTHGAAHLGPADVLSLRLGREVLGFLGGTLLHDAMERVSARGRDELPARLAGHLDRKIRHHQEPARSYAAHREALEEVLDGLLRERRLDIVYRRGGGRQELAGLCPLTLVVYRRAVYLFARDGERLRRLAVDRIVSVRIGAAFPYPEEWDPDAELRRYFGIVARGEPEPVVLRFSAAKAELVRARSWHPGERLIDLPGGGVELHFVAGGAELVRLVLEWGPHCEAVEPAWLRAEVRRELDAARALYGDPAPTLPSAPSPPELCTDGARRPCSEDPISENDP